MNKRERQFIENYTEKGSNTFGNATQSAISAGYSTRSAGTIAHRLLKKGKIKTEIENIDKIQKQEFELTKDQAIIEARQNYLAATTDNMKKYWNDIYLKLKGWDITKIESKNETTTIQKDEEKEEIQRLIRQYAPVN